MHTKCHHQNDDQEDNHPFPFDFRFDVIHIPFFFQEEQEGREEGSEADWFSSNPLLRGVGMCDIHRLYGF
jgi:hypothetical protein